MKDTCTCISLRVLIPGRQIRKNNRDNSKLFFFFPNENICCDSNKNRLAETVLIRGHKVCFYRKISTITVKPAYVATSIKGSPVLSSHYFWVP